MKKENNQLTSSRKVGMRDINTALSAPISRITTLRDDEGRSTNVGQVLPDNKVCFSPPCGESAPLGAKGGLIKRAFFAPPSALQATSSAREEGSCAFTLIELLVVILIVAILAAIAVPQYQRVVDKTRMMRALTLGKSIQRAEELYYAAYGTYTSNYEELDLDLPVKEKIRDNQFVSTSGDRYEFHVQQPSIPASVYAYFTSRGFLLISYERSNYRGKIVCYAASSRKDLKAICQSLTKNEPRGCAINGYCMYDL